MAQIRQSSGLEMENVGKTTRPFRYDAAQTAYDYTVEVTNKIPDTRSDREGA